MNLQEIRDMLDKVKNSKECGGGTTCKLYQGFGNRCTGACPFVGSFCDLQVIIHSLDEMLKPCCEPDTLKGTQQDCLKSLLRRIQKLENELQEKCISDRNGYNCLYEKCVANARSIDALKNDWNQVKEPVIDGNFTSLKVAVKAQYEELQRIKDHLYAIGRKGKE